MSAMERKLAAILAADVVGYSRLMEADEAGAFARLKERRQTVVEPELTKHRGRIFKLMGDGLLAEFASVVDAVECAVAVQRGMAERNINLKRDQRVKCASASHWATLSSKAGTGTATASISRHGSRK
jgi:adenylate cyclase